jgi:hypothetical protein
MLRRLTASLLLFFSAVAFATTTVPVQLLNPAGSSSGQTIVSTGASSAPGWATVPLSGLSSIAANTVVANATGSSAAPTAFSMPSCSTSSSALNYTTNIGIGCNTSINAATLVNATWASPPATGYGSTTPEPVAATTISATGLITPTSSIGIKGTTAADNAQAGSIGEFPSNFSNSTPVTSVTAVNCASLSLTAGDWFVSGTITYVPAAGTTTTNILAGINTTSATLPSSNVGAFNQLQATFSGGGAVQVISTPIVRVNISSSGTAYLIGYSSFSGSTMQCNGYMQATRRR